jgi:hypothetical protein
VILKNTAKKSETGIACTVHNEHIAKIAALPRGINICVFLQPLLALKKCWEAATSAIRRALGASGGRFSGQVYENLTLTIIWQDTREAARARLTNYSLSKERTLN